MTGLIEIIDSVFNDAAETGVGKCVLPVQFTCSVFEILSRRIIDEFVVNVCVDRTIVIFVTTKD